jgi:hypothetical protein
MYSEIDKRSFKRERDWGCSSAKRHCLLSLILQGSNDIVRFCLPGRMEAGNTFHRSIRIRLIAGMKVKKREG